MKTAIPRPEGSRRGRIGTKLVILLGGLLLGSVPAVVFLTASPFLDENTALIREMNSSSVAGMSERLHARLTALSRQMQREVQAMIEKRPRVKGDGRNDELLALYLFQRTPGGITAIQEQSSQGEIRITGPELLTRAVGFSIQNLLKGEEQVSLVRLADGAFLTLVGVPLQSGEEVGAGVSYGVVGLVAPRFVAEPLQSGESLDTFLVNRDSLVLARSSDQAFAVGTELSSWPGIRFFQEGKLGNGQNWYTDASTHQTKLNAYRRVGFGGLGIISDIDRSMIFAASDRVLYRIGLLVVVILCLAFGISYLFSESITHPIGLLVEAAQRIRRGDFAVNFVPRSGDELATLSFAFNEMARGLDEREKVKNLLTKFHSDKVVKHLLSKEARLGGERKQAIMLFSDLRGFTTMSEQMEPEQVVEMLNEYFSRMVTVIRKHGGMVDKYVGDAIVAVWGVPFSEPRDAYNAVAACLEMRAEVTRLNKLREGRRQSSLQMGMGLNSGAVIAGNIGSIERMEYTVIGDAVNIASRIESLTKEHATDLLVSRSVRDLVESHFSFETCGEARLKGKAATIEIFKVMGHAGRQGS